MPTFARAAARVLALFCTLCLVRLGASPQEKGQATFRGNVEMVTVDVSVLGRDRMPVRGLAMEDFTILEDGRPQQIASFGVVDMPDAPPASAAWMREVAPDVHRNDDLADRRLVVFVMDDATPMDAEDGPRLKKMARAVIDQLGPRDLAAVVFAMNKKNGQDLTSDHSRLLAAVDRFAGGVTMDSFVSKTSTSVTMSSSDFDSRALSMYEATLDTLRSVSEDLSALSQRRKAVVLASVGLPMDVTAAGPRIGLSRGEDSGQARRVVASLQAVLETAQRANVNVYGLGAGLKVAKNVVINTDGSGNRDVGQMNTDFLKGLSTSTGGFAIVDTDNPVPSFAQVLRENGLYYLLAYQPTNARNEGRFRRIEVRVNRPDVMVRARAGYYESSAAALAAGGSKPSLQSAMQAFIPRAELAMQVAATPFVNPGQKTAAVAVIVGVRQPTPAVTERTAEHTDVLVSAYDESGQRRGAERLQVAFTLRPGASDEVGYETLSRLNLPPGRYRPAPGCSDDAAGKDGQRVLRP